MAAQVMAITEMTESRTTVSDASESDLIVRARRGDAAAWRSLIEHHQQRVYTIAFRMIGDADEAQDVAQDVFIRFYRSLGRYRPEGRVATWLCRVTVNLAIDVLRQRARRNEETADVADSRALPDVQAEQHNVRAILDRIIRDLPSRQHRVLVLRDLQGFSTAEIAAILKCRQSTVRVHLARARLRIKEVLTERYPEVAGGMSQ